jgi:MarR family transcriptional regulator, organic hydroperoxide resistance regulator
MARATKLNLPDYLPYLVNRVGAALVLRFTDEALAQHRLTIAMWRVLVALADSGPQRQIDLSGLTSIDVSTLSRLVTRLVRARLVTRSRSTNSNREVTVGLTPAAAKLVARLIPIARQLERDATAGLSAAELQMTKQSLRHMYDNLAGRAQINGASMLRRARRAPKAAPRGGEAAGAAVQRRS